MRGADSPNNGFILAALGSPPLRVLDFGCGIGEWVARARGCGHDAWGADAYPDRWLDSRGAIVTEARPYVLPIEDGHIPFGNDTFDAIVSNQVFEHIQPHLVCGSLREIKRVLKPGGLFLAMFPTRDIWFEGHVGIYFVHRLCRWPSLQLSYLKICHALGFGYYRGKSTTEWASSHQADFIDGNIVYHSLGEINSHWSQVFGEKPTCLTAVNMRFRLQSSYSPLERVPAILDSVLKFIHTKRAGRALLIRKAGSKEMG
jgi:SAM-dependent methyltransferase